MPYIEEAGIKFSDLIDLTKSFTSNLGKSKSSGLSTGTLTKSSIMKASKDLVLSFPVLCSNTVTPQTAMMISKAIERNCVTTLQLIFASSYLQGPDGIEVLKKWHKNMDADFSVDDYLDTIDATLQTMEDNKGLLKIGEAMLEQFLADQKRYPLSSFSESSIRGFIVTENYNGDHVVRRDYIKEANNDDIIYTPEGPMPGGQAQFNQGEKKIGLQAQSNANQQYNADRSSAADKQKNASQNIRSDAKSRYDKNYNADKLDLDRQNLELQQKRDARGKLSDQLDLFTKQLMDSDVKKCNELVPSMIIVKFAVATPDTQNFNAATEKQFIAGVKARLIPCDSMEIIDRITVINKTRPTLVNLVRATTGEIKFARDFVFALDQAKIDARINSKLSKTSPIWRSLQARSSRSGINRLKKNKANDAGAITSLVLTSEEVNMLKKEYNFDLYNIAKARFVMESYNLMTLVIVDEEVEVARFLLDGEKYYQDYSFNSLERETGDGSYKKVINLISKINRG